MDSACVTMSLELGIVPVRVIVEQQIEPVSIGIAIVLQRETGGPEIRVHPCGVLGVPRLQVPIQPRGVKLIDIRCV